MESVKDLNMEADDMQGVLSALEGVNRRGSVLKSV